MRPFVAAAVAASLSASLAACASPPAAQAPAVGAGQAVPRELHLKCAGQMYSQRHGREAVNWAIYERCVRHDSR